MCELCAKLMAVCVSALCVMSAVYCVCVLCCVLYCLVCVLCTLFVWCCVLCVDYEWCVSADAMYVLYTCVFAWCVFARMCLNVSICSEMFIIASADICAYVCVYMGVPECVLYCVYIWSVRYGCVYFTVYVCFNTRVRTWLFGACAGTCVSPSSTVPAVSASPASPSFVSAEART